ncbi:MAG: glycosyltransferase family 1 protein [Phycisphaerae bacterium]|nr:glycosyltransferase family 1 protein [Phycisphaerae bacterium]
MKPALFTDTLEDINGVARFIRDMGEQARLTGRDLTIHTSVRTPSIVDPPFSRRNFDPLISTAMPYYPQLSVALPPAWKMLRWAATQRFDMIHCSTPGPVGLTGWLIARWLRIPLAATYHTDFPAYADRLTRSRLITGGTAAFMRWFYRPAAIVFARSGEYHEILLRLGVGRQRLRTIRPAINLQRFNPSYRDPDVWREFGVREPRRLLYIGRVSVEKNLQVLVDAFRQIASRRRDIALVVAGDGPFREPMARLLQGTPAYVLGVQQDRTLARLYASADLFAFPSRTDTLGQVVMEAQACGLPVLVSDEGGPKSIIEDGKTGRVVPGSDPARWAEAIETLIDDEATRAAMSAQAARHLSHFSLTDTFNDFWGQHEALLTATRRRKEGREAT